MKTFFAILALILALGGIAIVAQDAAVDRSRFYAFSDMQKSILHLYQEKCGADEVYDTRNKDYCDGIAEAYFATEKRKVLDGFPGYE